MFREIAVGISNGAKYMKAKKTDVFFVQFYTVCLLYSYVFSVRTGQADRGINCTITVIYRLFMTRFKFHSSLLLKYSGHLVFSTTFIRHTCNFLSFFLLYFYRKKFLQFYFCKFSYLDQFYSFTCAIHLYRFHYNAYSSNVLFFKLLHLIFLQKKFLSSFQFCKFSDSDQFDSFTCAIRLYRFHYNAYSSYVLIFKLLHLIFLQKKCLSSFYFCKFSYSDQFYSFTCAILFYYFLPLCLFITQAFLLSLFLLYLLQK